MAKSLIRPSFIQPEDLLDRLFKAWISHKIDELPNDEQRILERMEYADSKIKEGGVNALYCNLVNDMLEYFKDQKLSKRTIENDIARAKKFFASARPREEKEYARGKYIEWLERSYVKAEAAGEFKALAPMMRELKEIQNLHKEDPNRPDYEKYERKPILVMNDPTKLGLPVIDNLEEELAKLRGSKAAYLDDPDIDDVDFEEGDKDGI